MKPKNRIGIVYDDLTVLSLAENTINALWLCKCICGKLVKKTARQLTRPSRPKNCGCKDGRGKHGNQKRTYTPEEATWVRLYKIHKGTQLKHGFLPYTYWKQVSQQSCYYCGISPQYRYSNNTVKPILANGIDRLDNGIGYTENNCVPCCFECNKAKNTMFPDQFIEMCKRVARHKEAILNNGETNVD